MTVALSLRTQPAPAQRASTGPRVRARLRRALRRWRDRHDQRTTLAQLTDRELRDFGMSRWDAAHEAAKPFWRG